MADGDKIGTIVADPDFQSLGLADQQKFLSQVDPDFGKLKQGEFSTFLARYKGSQQSPEQQQISQLPDPVQQATRPLPAGLQPTEKAMQYSMGGMPQFVDVPKGTKQAFEQAGQQGAATGSKIGMSLPLIPTAIEAPLATALGVGGGIVGGKVGRYGGEKVAQKLGASPETTETVGDVTEFLGGLTGGAAGGKSAGLLPSTSRAGATMNQIVGANKNLTVPAFEASAEAIRGKELFHAGAPSLPAPMRRFLIRVQDPDKPPISLEEARDFYTASTKQTAKQWSEMSKPMQRQMDLFTKALGQNIEAALNAKEPGSGTALRKAMDEYSNAKSLQSLGPSAVQLGKGIIGVGAMDAWIRSLINNR